MLSSATDSLSSFSFDRFWSMDGYIRQRSPCAIFVTLFLFLSLLALLIYQLINVFSMDTISATREDVFSN